MLATNLVNVMGLVMLDPNPVTAEQSSFQTYLLPAFDLFANTMFTFDMIVGMLVLGLASYFHDPFNQLDFFVVMTGWLDALEMTFVDFSALRVLRVLRPLRLVRFFKGIQAIVGSILHSAALIMNVTMFMFFFLLLFGIFGVENFMGTYARRCVVTGPAVAGVTFSPSGGFQPAPNSYSSEDTSLYDDGEVAEMGEFEYWCSNHSMALQCPSNMVCDASYGNPHFGYTSFDNIFTAFLVMFQVKYAQEGV